MTQMNIIKTRRRRDPCSFVDGVENSKTGANEVLGVGEFGILEANSSTQRRYSVEQMQWDPASSSSDSATGVRDGCRQLPRCSRGGCVYSCVVFCLSFFFTILCHVVKNARLYSIWRLDHAGKLGAHMCHASVAYFMYFCAVFSMTSLAILTYTAHAHGIVTSGPPTTNAA